MRTRDEVLREEPAIVAAARQHVARCSHTTSDRVVDGSAVFLQDSDTYYRVGDLLAAYDVLADRIRELEAASGEPVAWAVMGPRGPMTFASERGGLTFWEGDPSRSIVPLYAHTPAPVVPVVTEAQLDSAAAAFYHEQYGAQGGRYELVNPRHRHVWREKARAVLTAALTAASEPVSNAYELPATVQAIVDAAAAYEKRHGHYQDYRMSLRDDAFPVDKTERAIVVAYRKHAASEGQDARPTTPTRNISPEAASHDE